MSLTLNSYLSLCKIEIRKDKKHYIVEDKYSGEFYEMPEICIKAIDLIQSGQHLGGIERNLKENYPHEEVDLLDFATQLIELNLVDEIDGIKIEKRKISREKQGFLWIPSRLGKFFFNKYAYFIYVVLFFMNLFLFIFHPAFFPHYKDLFISNYMALNIVVWTFLTIILLFIHELGHIFAMRAKGLPSKLEIGHRLLLVVVETDMSSVWKLPSKERNVLYMAGLCFDTVILSCSLISQLVLKNGPEVFLNIFHLVVLDTFIRMTYQFFFYMKTDLYFVIENLTGCYNLMENAQQVIKERLLFQKSKVNGQVQFSGEGNIVFLYSLFYLLGVVLTVSIFIFFYIRQILFAWNTVIPGFEKPPSEIQFWDAALFTVQNVIVLILLLYSWSKKYFRGFRYQ